MINIQDGLLNIQMRGRPGAEGTPLFQFAAYLLKLLGKLFIIHEFSKIMDEPGHICLFRGRKGQPLGQFFSDDGHSNGMEPEIHQALLLLGKLRCETVKDRDGKNDAADGIKTEEGDGLGDGGYLPPNPGISGIGIMKYPAGKDLVVFYKLGDRLKTG